MPNQANSISGRHRGWHYDQVNGRLAAEYNGTEVFDFDANDLAITPNTTVAGTLGVTGAATLSSTLAVTGATTLSSTLTIGACAPTYTFPAADGSCGQQLTTDGCAALSWAAASSGQYKTDLGPVCGGFALKTITETPVHRFTYDKARLPKQNWGCHTHEMTGIFAEEAPWAMQGKDKQAFSPINAFGMLMAALQTLTQRVERLEAAA